MVARAGGRWPYGAAAARRRTGSGAGRRRAWSRWLRLLLRLRLLLLGFTACSRIWSSCVLTCLRWSFGARLIGLLGRRVTARDVPSRSRGRGPGCRRVLARRLLGDDLLRLGGAVGVVEQHVDLDHLGRHPGVRLALVDLQVLGPGVGRLPRLVWASSLIRRSGRCSGPARRPLLALNHSFSASLRSAAVSFGSFWSCAFAASIWSSNWAGRSAAAAAEEVGDAADPAGADAEEDEADQKEAASSE